MNIKSIQAGKWYQTAQGIGQVVRVGGTHPPSVEIRIVLPFPRGTVFVKPREVQHEVEAPVQGGKAGV